MKVEVTENSAFLGFTTSANSTGWLVVTPARNEASRLPALAKSLRDQEVCPIGLWIIVDDGSSDGTGDAVCQDDVPFPLLVVRKQNDGGLRGGSAFTSFFYGAEVGLQHLPDAKRILKLDADVVLARGYFKALAAAPEEVALIGGVAAGWRDREQTDLVPGFLKAYNREAFEIVRALPRAIGLDMIDESALRHRGLEVRVVRDAHARVRQIGETEGILRGRWRNGIVSRWVGYHPLYFAMRVLRYAVRRPVGIGAIALVWGYATSGSGPYPKELKAEMRERQRAKLRRLARQPFSFLRESYDMASCDDPECCAPRSRIRVDAAAGERLDVVRLCGVDLHALDFESAADRIVELGQSGLPALVVTTNVDHVVLLQADDEFRLAYESSTLRVADGVPLVVLSRLVGRPLPGRVNGTNLIPAVCERAARLGVRVAFVGGEPGVPERAAERLAELFPGLKVAACVSPEFGFDQDPVRSCSVAQSVCSSGADVVFLGLGAPKQEIWASRWLSELGGTTVVCVGGALDYLAGTKRRAPVFMQRWGMEWLFRLLGEPRRLWRRYLVQDLAFFGLALRELLSRGPIEESTRLEVPAEPVRDELDFRSRPELAVLMTCHNRREKTLACLQSLFTQEGLAWELSVVLVDAGSTDGTADAVRTRFPKVKIHIGASHLYWAGGMRLADEVAALQPSDFLLWLNDDVVLDRQAISNLLHTYREIIGPTGSAIVVGATRDPTTAELTYSGVVRALHRTRFSLVPPSAQAREAETMNGNVVLVSANARSQLGNLDPAFQHGMADFDYGLRARALGIPVWVAPNTVGTCSRNLPPSWKQATVKVPQRFQALRSPKGLPPRDWAVFTRRHAGSLWPFYWASPYVRAALRGRA